MRNILDKSYRENQNTRFLFAFVWKLCLLWDNVGKYRTTRKATDDNIIQPMRVVCCIPKATDRHSEYVILLFHSNNDYANAPSCYIHTYIACLAHRPTSLAMHFKQSALHTQLTLLAADIMQSFHTLVCTNQDFQDW